MWIIHRYNSQWYKAPLHVQKLVLFMLQRNMKEFNLNICGLITGSLESFTMVNIIYTMRQSKFNTLYFMYIYIIWKRENIMCACFFFAATKCHYILCCFYVYYATVRQNRSTENNEKYLLFIILILYVKTFFLVVYITEHISYKLHYQLY